MSEAGRVRQLVGSGEVLAEHVVTGGDFPWLSAEVRSAAGFAEIRPLFGDELRELELLDKDPEPWEAACPRMPLAPHRAARARVPAPHPGRGGLVASLG